jgi:hypothetical protein
MAYLLPLKDPEETIEPLYDLEKLAITLGKAAAYAAEVNLPHLQYGLYGYQQVTKAVTEQLDTGFFEYPDKMERTMPVFAERALAPLRFHAHDRSDLVGAWSPLFYRPEMKQAAPWMGMVDFLNFHVIYDLPFTLLETGTKPEHKQDYTGKMNQLFKGVGRDLLPLYIDMKPPWKQLGVAKLGLAATLRYLYGVRDDAWDDYLLLLDSQNGSLAANGQGALDVMGSPEAFDEVSRLDSQFARKAAVKMVSSHHGLSKMTNAVSSEPRELWKTIQSAA